ncbi:zinc-dependent metalloprotease [Capnocytophaga canimorsus]|uniref:zinc-dependent metalloprotease n=1 Tax=Capnocytophaga canimorsus TaxID=28188 RepID=UPI001561FCC8|nr:zinc-dependent metalloprotease [Capnocytophaga canimorsus]
MFNLLFLHSFKSSKNKMIVRKRFLLTFFLFFVNFFVFAQVAKKSGVQKNELSKKDSTQTQKEKAYQDLLNKASVSKGMFNVIRKGNDYYFEIPNALLDREFMIVNKISQVPMQLNEAGINKGMNFENKIIVFEKDTLSKKLWVKTHEPMISSPKEDAITQSVQDNFGLSVLEFFDIHTYNTDSTAVVVKVNKVFDGKEKSFNDVLTHTGLGGAVKSSLSFIRSMKSFPENIVVRADLSTSVNEGGGNVPITIGVTSNLVLLPKEPMKPRFEDERIGYFTQKRWFFNDEQHALEKRKIVTRWRIEPHLHQIDNYLRGELVEPQKPIVFYIDPATPKKWRKYIIQGVNDWNKAFERAGFKNAIMAKEVDKNDTNFDIDDVRYSSITYVASPKANAMGPSVVDPRSGEIIESDVIWWHNVMAILHNWMRVQTGASNPKVRSNQFDDEQMGESIRFVSSHEIGHTLGLKHNMGASYAYAVDSLRSASFIKKNGISTSIMDYARYNYVAQPQDNVPALNPEIGEYDKYAIEWGYRWFPDEEKAYATLRKFVDEHCQNPLYFYGEQQNSQNVIDPRSQSEDLGDNSVKASEYGLKNLEFVLNHLLEWTAQENQNYYKTGKLYTEIINQWQLYNRHVLSNIGGMYLNNMVFADGQKNYQAVPYHLQKQAVDYLNKNVFSIPQWLFFNKEILAKTYPIKDTPIGNYETSAYALAREYQYAILYEAFDDERLLRLMEAQWVTSEQEKTYSVEELFADVRNHIFAKTRKRKSLSVLERMTQKNYVDGLIISIQKLFEKTSKKTLIEPENNAHRCGHSCNDTHLNAINFSSMKRVSEVTSLKRQELRTILKMIKGKGGDKSTKAHYQDLIIRIEQELGK